MILLSSESREYSRKYIQSTCEILLVFVVNINKNQIKHLLKMCNWNKLKVYHIKYRINKKLIFDYNTFKHISGIKIINDMLTYH